uniref:40S ribosomal protein S12 n=1 Tax=Brugia timori TaxID=42155 RepID=A0A0R3Q558_9BILA
LRRALKSAIVMDGVAKGLHEAAKALDKRQAYFCVLAENCDEPMYAKLVEALCSEHQIPLIRIKDKKQLGEWIGLCKYDKEGKARKVVGCSCVVVRDYGQDDAARAFLQERLITFMKKTSPVFWIAANGFLRFHKYRMCGCFRILDASVVGELRAIKVSEKLLFCRMTKSDEPSSVTMEEVSYGAEEYTNDPSFEIAWAVKAAERANVHMNLLLTCNTAELTMHKKCSIIYDKFREFFPEMNVEKVTEIELKGENKQRWFTFCEYFKEEVEDYNLATIMRIRVDGAYSESNTIIVPKIIFLAVEIARNKEGLNERCKESFKMEHEKIRREGGNIC